jgi:hypothetical protein
METFAQIIDRCQHNTATHRLSIGKLRALK